jgi:hypothetical protein
MFRLLGSAAVTSALVLGATDARADYVPYVYHQHDHFHYLMPPRWDYLYPAPYAVYVAPYSLEYAYPPRPRYYRKKKRTVRTGPLPGKNWYYCRSYWRQPTYVAAGPRFWWPYYNPRPTNPPPGNPADPPAWKTGDADPCNYSNPRLTAPGYRPY